MSDVLISAEEISAKLEEMGRAITEDYQGKDLLIVGVLKGAFIVMADLARHIDLPVEFDFMAVSSYGAATQTSGVVRILKDLDQEIAGRWKWPLCSSRREFSGCRSMFDILASRLDQSS